MRLALFAFLLLAACAATEPRITSATDRVVIVNWATTNQGAGSTLPVAERHCAQYGKRAVFKERMTSFDLVYECVQ